MIIQIVGYGFVGQAHAWALSSEENTIAIYDPAKGYGNWWKNADCYIICVSTPMSEDGSCDMSNVYETLESCPEDTPILIKSTISLEGWRKIQNRWPKKTVTFSPEFLRADHAFEDFKNQKHILFGGGDMIFWPGLFSDLDCSISYIDPEVLILAKYFRNAFLATKVAFFNQIHDLCKATDVDYESVAKVVGADKRIGSSHTTITEERGYGGHCFPKDVQAILSTADLFGEDLSILEEVKRYNKDIRGEN